MDDSRAIAFRKSNGRLIALAIALQFFALFAVPVLIAKYSALWGLALIPFVLFSNGQWSLIHEAIHGGLANDKAWNARFGAILSALHGGSFQVFRFGHLMHHQYNREWESEYYANSREKTGKTLQYYWSLFGGLYVTGLLASIAILVLPNTLIRSLTVRFNAHRPEVRDIILQYFFARDRLSSARRETMLMLAFYAPAFAFYGAFWPLLASAIAGRAILISFFDNIYHYGTPIDNSQPALELEFPAWMSRLFLHFNYHRTHHRYPNASWHHLPTLHRQHATGFDTTIGAAGRRQLAGPIQLPSPIADASDNLAA